MNSCSNAQSKEVGCHQDAPHGIMNLSEHGETPLEPPEDDNEDEDEDGDVDFNPFLKDTPSPEASSSPISEVEFLDAEIADSNGDTITSVVLDSSKLSDKVKGSAVGDSERREDEIVTQSSVSSGGSCQTELAKDFLGKVKKRKLVSISEPGIETVQGNENGFGEGTVVDDEVDVRNLGNTTNSRDPIMEIDDEDAICRRTRARYSLASFTLDELETFLQETDDEDDLQNVDDEEEYKKFLASVLQGGDGDGQADQENNNIDDDDEDNDADFEIEIEEALESDIDENIGLNTRKDDYEEAGRRPETRQKRRQKASTKNQKKLLQPTNRPLRPLVPIMPNAPIAPFHACEGRSLTPGAAPHCLSSSVGDSSLSSFTPHQFGQLHCLIHEHVQLLIQIYSLCMLEPSRQHVASQVQGLISEMLSKRDQALAWRSVAYPDFCFRPPYVHASVDELSNVYPDKCISDSSLTHNAQRDCFSVEMSHLCNHFPSEGRCDYVSNEGAGSCQTMRGFSWLPFIGGPLLSILDVAPLNLVGRYMDDVKLEVREHRRRHMEETCDFRIEREPLFPLPSFPAVNETSGDASTGTGHPSAETALSSSPSHQPTKKTLAATLVESSKKQSVALVPKEIVKLSQRFFPLFNPALFPRKPPPLPVVNRVLFTDAEDELLAMGLMECNTDWKAIQQRFLPCKSKHQIFVRQKNRCSSKAPENPIKAVRRMKTSPLTADEIARIQEGLRVFKLDWMSIWKFMVPHRDPSLLPRQWRIALGIQKSYKIDAAQKEKRRLYESKRRKIRAADSANWETACQREGCQTNILGEKNSGYDSIDNEDETYVHEAFLADWRPGTFNCRSSAVPCSNIREKNLQVNAQSQGGSCIKGQLNACWSQESQPQNSSVKKFPHALANSEHPYTSSQFTQVRQSASDTLERNPPTSDLTLKSSPLYMRSYRGRRANNAHLVKLAPDLPPVNLPSSARVISQSAFRSYQCGPLVKASVTGGGIDGSAITRAISELPNVTKVGTVHLMEARGTKSNSLKCNASNSCLVDSNLVRDDCVTEEKGTESDLQMHPLLFEAPEDGCLPYYPLNCSNRTSSSFSFLSGSQPQVSLSLFSNPHQANPSGNCSYKSSKSKKTTSTSCGIDFHPLLQRTDEVNGESVTACSTAPISVALGFLNSSDANQTGSRINTTPLGTKTYSLNEKVNELDLEINLSYTSRMEKAIGVTPSNNAGRCSIDNVGDQSLPEIVMEQEELSDSDEDNGEHVEFECEEMADSEGEEESDCEQIDDPQYKDAPNLAVEKVSSIVDYDDQQWELRIQGNCQGDVSIPGEDSTPSVTLGLKSHGKVVANNSSWLRLDSQAAGCPLSANKVHVDSLNGKGSSTKVRASCHPNKSCKKTISSAKGATAQKHVMDMPQQLSLTSNLLRKSRKRATRSNLNLNTQMPVESSDSIGNDKIG